MTAEGINGLSEPEQNTLAESAEREGLKQQIKEMREFLEQQSAETFVQMFEALGYDIELTYVKREG